MDTNTKDEEGYKKLENEARVDSISAFDDFYRHNWKALFHIAYSAVSSEEEAKDLVQNAFINFWNARDKLDSSKNIKAYLFTSLKNGIINFYKREIIRKNKIAHITTANQSYSPLDENYNAKELSREINKEIAHLPRKMQEIFILSRHQHLSVLEISQHLNITQRTVKNQLSNALRILRARMDVWR